MSVQGQSGSVRRLLAPVLGLLLALALGPAAAAGTGVATRSVPQQPAAIYVQSARTSYAELVDALDRSGYQIVSVATTMLNRVLIRARNRDHLREIVFSRASGRILRDGIVEYYRPGDRAAPVPIERILRNTETGIGVINR